jgi:hypothetical protein
LCVDYLGLLNFSDRRNKNDYRVNTGEVIKDTKSLALTFRNGDGLPIITPHQINRDGWEYACKTDPPGEYTPKALSETNEIIASCDLMFTIFLDEVYKSHNEAMFGSLKIRDDKLVPYHLIYCNQDTRYIGDLDLNSEGPVIDHEGLIQSIEF